MHQLSLKQVQWTEMLNYRLAVKDDVTIELVKLASPY